MRTRMMQTVGISLIAGSMALSHSAFASEGLYSAKELLGADVYDNAGEDIGQIEDVLLGNDMSVHAVVIKTGDFLGMGGTDVVADRGSFTVQVEQDDSTFGDIDYQVHVEGNADMVKNMPEYDESWWNQTRESLSQAWENTKDTTESAWESTRQATASAWQNVKEWAENMRERATN